jgi:transglutaminase-like putative cysteine protease
MTMLIDTRPDRAEVAGTFDDERAQPDGALTSPPRPWATEVAVVVMTLAALASMHRCFSGWGSDWVGPVLLTGMGVHLVCRLTRRYVDGPIVGGLIDVASVVLLAIWTVVPASTNRGVPTWRTWHTISIAFDNIAGLFATAATPVRPTTAFLLLGVGGAGVVALASSWLVLRNGRGLLGALPGFACFIVCAAIGTRTGRGWATAIEVAALSGYLLVERTTAPRPPGVLLGHRPAVAGTAEVLAGVAIAAVAVLVASVTVPAFGGPNGHGPLGWNVLDPSSTRIVISPLVDLRTRLLQDGDRPVFTVKSNQPSYWRLTSLNEFNGVQWNANDTYESVDHDLSGVIKPDGTRQVTERFDIEDLDSPWAPLAFDPETITGAGKVSYDPRSGSLLTPHNTSNGLDYTVVSVQYLADLSARKLAAAPPLAHASPPSHSLQLPAIPGRVRRLAKRLVAGKRTEYAKALALQSFFHTSEFTYTLDPPSDGSATTALENFLFSTREGYCQQFAGSFAVLARLDGLPTRLAVGFTTGQAAGADTYRVTDADAHTWPEVWFPTYGWIPFEPTQGSPGHGFAIPGAFGYTGNTTTKTSGGKSSSRSPTTPIPSGTETSPPVPATAVPSGGGSHHPTQIQPLHRLVPQGGKTGSAQAGHHAGRAASKPSHGGAILLSALAAVLLVVALLGAGNGLRRRRRWHTRRSPSPTGPPGSRGAAITLAAWAEVQETLAWHGILRHNSETLTEMAQRVASREEFDRRGPGRGRAADHLRRLAELATLATYTGSVPGHLAAEADTAAVEVRASLHAFTTMGQRVRLLFDPRLSWRGPVASTDRPFGSSRPVRTSPWVAHPR